MRKKRQEWYHFHKYSSSLSKALAKTPLHLLAIAEPKETTHYGFLALVVSHTPKIPCGLVMNCVTNITNCLPSAAFDL